VPERAFVIFLGNNPARRCRRIICYFSSPRPRRFPSTPSTMWCISPVFQRLSRNGSSSWLRQRKHRTKRCGTFRWFEATASDNDVLTIPFSTQGAGSFCGRGCNFGPPTVAGVSSSSGNLPVNVTICQTNPSNGECMAPPVQGGVGQVSHFQQEQAQLFPFSSPPPLQSQAIQATNVQLRSQIPPIPEEA